jgi:hypothetical protein
MKRAYWNFVVDAAGGVLFLGMLATGFILRFPLPPGTQRSHLLWGLTRHEWGTVHTWISFGLIAVLLIHLALHWSWIYIMLRSRFGRKKPAGPANPAAQRGSGIAALLGLVLLCALFAWGAMAGVRVEEPVREPQGERLQPRERGGGPLPGP